MANTRNRSRSPVRAFNTVAHPAWANVPPRPRSWSEPTVREMPAAVPYPLSTPAGPQLACPDCGAQVQLALVPAAGAAFQEPAPVPHAAPEDEMLPAFDDSVRAYKRQLVQRALQENDGVMTRAAKALGLKYTTFVAMVHRLEEEDGED